MNEQSLPTYPSHIVAVAGVIRNEEGNILLIKSPLRGWEPPGGQVEVGEDLLTALKREVLEETGCTVKVGGLVGVQSNLRPPTKVMLTL